MVWYSKGFGHEEMECQDGQRCAYNYVDEIMVGKIHGRPVEDTGI
jgi:hypothetical protein